jgi:guanosine-3',5'-bis(diphosphate) 3'-pyrophosphohydrolase
MLIYRNGINITGSTVEDTGTAPEEIEKEFGANVRAIVAQVTDDKSQSKVDRKKHQVEASAHKTRQAKLVKLGDKLYNCRDLLSTPPPDW